MTRALKEGCSCSLSKRKEKLKKKNILIQDPFIHSLAGPLALFPN